MLNIIVKNVSYGKTVLKYSLLFLKSVFQGNKNIECEIALYVVVDDNSFC